MCADTPTVAYVVKAFPRATETFIAHEIRLLEAMGLPIRIYSIKPGESGLGHEVLARIRAEIVALPDTASLSETSLFAWLAQHRSLFSAAHVALLRAVPRRYLRTLSKALWMCWRHRKPGSAWPRKVFIKEFLQAGAIAVDIVRRGDVHHLHGHFCHGATTVTWLVSELCGLAFSFTAHAKDIYEPHLNPRQLLARKIEAARFIATCTDTNRQHLASLAPAAAHVHTIYHGLDPEFFCPATPVETRSAPLILAVGRMIEKKGFAYLVEACAALRRRGIAFRCQIVGAPGDASPGLEAAVRRHALADDCVQFVPAMTQQALRDRYREAAVFVLPCLITSSGDRDGIPNVLAEAMASGVPVISTPISGIPELIRDGREGLLVPDRDADALTEALAALLADGERRRLLGAAARARICAMFDSRETTRALHGLLCAALGMRS